jgi:hypothetical protein
LSSQEFHRRRANQAPGCHLLTASECVERERGLCRLLRKAGLFGKLERRHGAFRTTFSVAASVTLLKHLEKFRAPAIAS